MRKRISFAIYFFIFVLSTTAQRIEPSFWWIDMHNTSLQLMVHHKDIGNLTPKIDEKSIELKAFHKAESANYLFLDLEIAATAKAGKIKIDFYEGKSKKLSLDYELKNREPNSAQRLGFGPQDVIYMLMPDRFANGNPNNDSPAEMLEKADRSNPNGRHGGDVAGIHQNLEYISKLGITALWINPLLENNQPKYSYHGYAITDFYRVDPRFGSNEDYKNLVKAAQQQGIKVMMDMVFNHCGDHHWWMRDLPFQDWVHQFSEFTRSNYRSEALMDPHASAQDQKLMNDGWFDHSMPDLNQKNPFLARYLIQNSIWWIEYAGLQGVRMDTYPYSDQTFMAQWVDAVMSEYPNFNIVGEAWLQTVPHTAYFQSSTFPQAKAPSHLQSVTDFPLNYALNAAFNQKEGWTEGMANLYMVLAQDFVYQNADSNVIFLDNHDITRFATQVEMNIEKYKMGITFLLTTRGIPQLYYGDEIMLPGNKSEGDASLRPDMPGGWLTDKSNVFNNQNLDQRQSDVLDYTRKILHLRKQHLALQSGKLLHYIPQDGVYVYFRFDAGERFMIIFNNNDQPKDIDITRFEEGLNGAKSIKSMEDNEFQSIMYHFMLPQKSAQIFQLK